MQLFQIVFIGLIFDFFFLTAAALSPTISCPSPPKFYSTLPYNFSIQTALPREVQSGEYHFYSIRLEFSFLGSSEGWDYTKFVPEKTVGVVFQLINGQLIPVGGSSTAYLLRETISTIIFNPVGFEDDFDVRNLTFQAKLACNDKGNHILSLIGDNCEFFLFSFVFNLRLKLLLFVVP